MKVGVFEKLHIGKATKYTKTLKSANHNKTKVDDKNIYKRKHIVTGTKSGVGENDTSICQIMVSTG